MNYKKCYDALIDRAKNRDKINDYFETHHIKPRCMGGTDDPSNLVDLTPEEHFIAHLLLVKIYPHHKGLVMAVRMMCMTSHGRKNKEYAWVRRKISENMSSCVKNKWATKYGFKNYTEQCEAVFQEFLKTKNKSKAGSKWGLSEPNSIQSINFWAKITGQEQLVRDLVKEAKANNSRISACNAWNNKEKANTRRNKKQNRKDRKPISADGTVYESVSMASKILGVERGTVSRRCKSANFPTWFYC